ncbi:protein LEAD-SENSITIVE 1-like [Ziziphus jujuba]|uniref:Protein LEAD-SENSITIVE 1-like n=1 Tax=Ziziphus jujuba TaxID=326968 RepID=A0ABM4A668_ZIZJJ|nr:protein LEAD-SENSITIVE 1-like [Ziziphus jujuba]
MVKTLQCSNDSSSHYRFINNGKDFAMYCKTGLLVIDNINFSRSWQAAAFFLAVTVTFFLFLQQITDATFTGVIATCFGLYCIYRFGSDIGARPNVIKVDQVETLPRVAKELSSAASGFRPIQSLIDLFIVLLMTLFNIPLLLTVRTWSEPRQLLSETPRVVWILACIVLFYLAILQKRLLSNKIHKKQLKPGDHIYAWRGFSRRAHAHHGIYVGDIHGSRQKEVIHLVRAGDPILPSSSATSNQAERTQGDPILPRSSVPGNQAERTHVNYCSLEDFLNGDELYLYKYGVSLAFFIAKTRGGTCTLGSADPPRSVLYRGCQRLQGYDAYNLINNNCEDLAIHCKTGLPLRTGAGR